MTTALISRFSNTKWPLGKVAKDVTSAEHEFFVLVATLTDLSFAPRCFVLPRTHVSAAVWIQHMQWLTDPSVPPGSRNTPMSQARCKISIFDGYESRWDLLRKSQSEAPVLLPPELRTWALNPAIALPEGHPWASSLPDW